ncbi:MAG: GNAT family N-acetyltransferase [Nocardioides sp.]|nr:GNAT family N-acetyltransferase [Nocardioides sp.]
MSRRTEPLTREHLAVLDAPCRHCVFWEVDPVRRGRLDAGEAAAEKEAWLGEVLREWGSCGRVMLVDGRPAGYATYAPAAFVPGADGFATAPVSPDAVLLTTVYVDRAHSGGGLGRMLVQAMAADLLKRDVGAVEAFGDLRGPGRLPKGPGTRCVVPVDFLGRVGFVTQRPHPTTPRLRMDLRATVTWRGELEAAVERLLGAVRPERAPTPSPKATRSVRVPGREAAQGGRLR